jgi:hypothetical protein
MTTYSTALALLPTDAQWSCTFGNQGEGGYCEYHRRPNGERWIISNGPYYLHPFEFDWHCQRCED